MGGALSRAREKRELQDILESKEQEINKLQNANKKLLQKNDDLQIVIDSKDNALRQQNTGKDPQTPESEDPPAKVDPRVDELQNGVNTKIEEISKLQQKLKEMHGRHIVERQQLADQNVNLRQQLDAAKQPIKQSKSSESTQQLVDNKEANRGTGETIKADNKWGASVQFMSLSARQIAQQNGRTNNKKKVERKVNEDVT
eukprot:TRINITY_DN3322_c0_g1_i1.p1 TRINITY_DN3322_c0_g1~~TRINITY_DN3322_c0_g1_i1.p1  ORF type:complete len:200 (+),score=51.62 TRINITY_DN3322_c0_g1_i1:47-646(+)